MAAVLVTAVSAPVLAQPAEPEVEQQVAVSLLYPAPSLTPLDTFALKVRTTLTTPAEYFEVRVRIYRPSGALLYQKTEVRHDVEAGDTSLDFERTLADIATVPGRYPVEVRVLVSGAEQTTVKSRVLVTDETFDPLPVAVVVRLDCSPAFDPSGRFVLDPATHDSQRKAIDALITLVSGRSESLTIAVPPLLLEEWSRVASGYQLIGPEGVVEVPSDADVPRAYASTLDALSLAAQTGRVELLDVPYAEPNVGGLQQIGAIDDLAVHYTLGRSVYQTVLGTKPSTGTGLCTDMVPASAAQIMAETDHDYFLCSADSQTGPATTGVHRESRTGTIALLTDSGLAALMTSGTAEDIYDHIYDAAAASNDVGALVIMLDLGPGQEHTTDDLERLLATIDSVSWLKAIPAVRAAQLTSSDTIDLIEKAPAPTSAPADYWSEVSEARRNALGLVKAWGPEDPAGAAALSAALIAESYCWAGPDDSYPFADRGRAFAASVTRLADDVFGGIHVEMRDVTLAGRTGDVPLTIVSTTNRELILRVETSASRLSLRSTEETAVVEPGDNFLTIPVDLGTAISDSLEVRVLAGDVLVAKTTVTVHASYLDRVSTVAVVVLVLIGLLLFIRRRVKTADAGSMPVEAGEGHDATPDHE
ncbi:MAG: hypothetical protein Q7J82_10215 [Coriobacteriia bacterium]|nr:hypothetical protein [Coriobacteriia bacterium]